MRIYAHRGMRRQAPENTLAAFSLAIRHGFSIELDVRLTRDEQVVCLHDAELGRTVPVDGMVWGYALAELQALDAGQWFAAQYAGERVPTLAAALELAIPETHFAVELKCPGIERQVIEVLREKRMVPQVFLFDIGIEDVHFATRMKSIGADVRVGRNCVALHDFQVLRERHFEAIDVIMAVTRSGWLTAGLVEIAHQHGVAVIDTGVHDLTKMQQCLDLGLDGICSDCPDEVSPALSHHVS
ncbi:MAG: hypothetical protein HY710_02805 [Candidatus Latescibacteria bacterium]|nr:hypothetical protein [Candidatus Latescibacterota bacterium]